MSDGYQVLVVAAVIFWGASVVIAHQVGVWKGRTEIYRKWTASLDKWTAWLDKERIVSFYKSEGESK